MMTPKLTANGFYNFCHTVKLVVIIYEFLVKLWEVREEGHEWGEDADIKAFLDTVNYDKLIDAVAEQLRQGNQT
jgi:retron-type reverse transcriptase